MCPRFQAGRCRRRMEFWMRQKVELLSLISKRLGLPDTIFSLGEVPLDVV